MPVSQGTEGLTWSGPGLPAPVPHSSPTEQNKFVAGNHKTTELAKFKKFMGNNTHRLNWPYSNPNYTLDREAYVNTSYVRRYYSQEGNARYLTFTGKQGGYYCSIRSWTSWENAGYLFEHPNYWSR